MRHVILAVFFALYAWVSTALEVDFGAMEFSSGIPEGWQEALSFKEGNNLSFSDPETIVGRKVLSVNMYNASSNATRIVYRSEPLEDVECDNVSVDIIGYHKRGLSGKLDKIQMVISTDNFQSYVPVGPYTAG